MDSPRFALTGREALLPAGALLAASGIAWWATLGMASDRAMMPTCHSTMGMGALTFLGMWTAMMTGMMFPSVAPVAILWSRAIVRVTSGAARAMRLTLFVGGYLAAWAALGVIVYALLPALEAAVARVPWTAPWLAMGILAAAGAYQLTPWKEACLEHCRSPMALLAHYTGVPGRLRDLRVGAHHGLYCVGCCAGLMAVLLAVGVMNVPAMVVLTVVVFLEKTWRGGEALARVSGVALLILAVLAPFEPWLSGGLVVTGGSLAPTY